MIRHIIFLFFAFPLFAQDAMDSLWTRQESRTYEDALNAIKISKSLRDSNIKLALSNNQKAVEILEELQEDSLLAVALAELAVSYSYSADYENSFPTNHRAMELAQKSGDTLTIIDANNNIGIDYYYLEDFEKSLTYFEKVANLAELSGNSIRMANAYNNLGLVSSEMGLFDQELEYYFKAREIHKKNNYTMGIAMTELNIGSVYLLEKEYQKAENSLNTALNLYLGINNKSGEYDTKSSLITLYEETGRLEKSIKLAEATLADIREKEFRNTERHYLELLEGLYFRSGQIRKAYQSLKDLKELESEILNEEQSKIVAELETQYQTAEKEREITSLALQNQRAQLQLEQEESRRNILFAAIAVLFLVILFFIWRYRYKQKIASILEDKNKVITESLEQRETLLKEIHHRVKNNLQIISSLLNLQSRFMEDKNAIDAVKEGRDRVKSMAMIHQKLYQNEDLTGVDIKDYITNLVESLEKSYGIDDDKIKVNLDIDSMLLDIDTTIPLGLILNELVSNSLKYAFPDDREGELKILLKKHSEYIQMDVSDDGIGFQKKNPEQGSSFGLTLIESLAEKLKAEYLVENGHGTSYSFKIKQFKLA